MKRRLIVTISLSLSLVGVHGGARAQQTPSPSPAPVNGVSGSSLLGPDGTYRVTENSPPIVNVPAGTSVEIVPAGAPEPAAETTGDQTSEPVATDTDGDGVADSDEVDLFGTDPETWDTNGDGVSDGGVETATDSSPSLRTTPLPSSRKTVPVPRASIATLTASRMPTKPPSGRTPPPRMPTAMATTTVTRSTWAPIPLIPPASLSGSER